MDFAAKPIAEKEKLAACLPTLLEAQADKRPVAEIDTASLEIYLHAYTVFKLWSSDRFYDVRDEVQRRATRRWVHDDAFGNTFAPLAGTFD
jgi:hypothetical protein